MRFTRTLPANSQEFRDQVLRHAEAIAPGLKILASQVAVQGRGVIDLLASDERGRLVLLTSAMRITPAILSRAMGQWDWLLRNLETLRSLAPFGQCDMTQEPRLVLVAPGISAAARRMAGCIARPGLELLQVVLLQAGDREGLLVETVAPVAPPRATGEEAADPLLAGLPPGEARSAARRVLERLKSLSGSSSGLLTERLDGCVDVRHEGRTIATFVAGARGLRLRMAGRPGETEVVSEDDCDNAARQISELAGVAPAGVPDPASPARTAAGRVAPMAALTDEEIAEFERLAGGDARSEEPQKPGNEAEASPAGFVEN